MSLAEKISAHDGAARGLNAVATPAIDNILRLALNGAAGQRQIADRPAGDIDFGKAATLLDRATSALTLLTSRRDELEQAAAAREEYFGEKLRQLQDQAAEWERRAKVIKAQLNDAEIRLSEQQARLESLTYRAENAETRMMIAEQQAGEARKHLQLYHDKILDTFASLA